MMLKRLAIFFVLVSLESCGVFTEKPLTSVESLPLAEETPRVACPELRKLECPTPVAALKKSKKERGTQEKFTIGGVESFTLHPWLIDMDARIDTGATTSSIHADNITYFERDGKRWVRFTVGDKKKEKSFEVEKQVKRRVVIRSFDEESREHRPVVEFLVSLAGIKQRIEVTLANRKQFDYRLLIGRNFLRDLVVVDVSEHHLIQKPIATNSSTIINIQ